jgi:hypothetical protein
MLVETSRVDPAASLSARNPAPERETPDVNGAEPEGTGPGDRAPGPLEAAVLDACSSPDTAAGFTDWLREVVRRLDEPAS